MSATPSETPQAPTPIRLLLLEAGGAVHSCLSAAAKGQALSLEIQAVSDAEQFLAAAGEGEWHVGMVAANEGAASLESVVHGLAAAVRRLPLVVVAPREVSATDLMAAGARDVVRPEELDDRLPGVLRREADRVERLFLHRELESSRRRLESIIESLPDATFAIDLSRRVIAWNRAIEEMTGIPKARIIGRGEYAYAEPFYGERRPLLVDVLLDEASGDSPHYESIHRGGQGIWAEVYTPHIHGGKGGHLWGFASPLFDRDGNMVGAIESVRDITERKEAQEELLRKEEQLRHTTKMEAIGRLAGGVAHDFNNLLTVILGNCQMLQADCEDSNIASGLEQIHNAARRAADLTTELLTFARKSKLEIQQVDLHETIGEVISLLGHGLEHGVTIETELSSARPVVLGDPGQLEHALLNLGLNARDALPDGGKIVFATEDVTIAEGAFRHLPEGLAPGRYVRIRVSDTGVGMDEQTVSRLFEPFFTTKEVGKGTGLGLASVYGCVQNHKGAVMVSSTLGRGTTFTVFLPVAGAEGGGDGLPAGG